MNPPKLADALLRLFYNPRELEDIQGDLYELFEKRVSQHGLATARKHYWLDAIRFIRPFSAKRNIGPLYQPEQTSNPVDMLRNYVQISLRNLLRNRTVSLINGVGLAIGLASGLILFLLVSHFFSFDRYHTHADRTYWVVTDVRQEHVTPTDAAPRPMAEALRRDYSFVETAVRLETMFNRTLQVPGETNQKFEESRNICFTEPEYFRVFDVLWVAGNQAKALTQPNSLVLSERYARKYFGDANPLGQRIRFDNQLDLTVTGVMKNPPSNTQLRFDALVSYATLPTLLRADTKAFTDWKALSSMCFVVLKEGVSVHELEQAFPAIQKKQYDSADARTFEFKALSLKDLVHERSGPARRPILYALIAMGLCLVGAACINFVNITTAQAIKRSKEIGIRKVVGSTKSQLIAQFLTETTLLALFAVIIALFLTELCLPFINRSLAMMNMDLSVAKLLHPREWGWFTGLLVLVIALTGLYPAFIHAGFNPIAALQGTLTNQKVAKFSVRKGLIIVQFFITQLFIIGVIVIMSQLRYMQKTDLGFQQEAILMIPMPTKSADRQQAFRTELLKNASISQVSLCNDPPASYQMERLPFSFDTRTTPEKFGTALRAIDSHYASVFQLKLVAGQNFTSDDTTQRTVLVNQKMINQLGLHSPAEAIGKSLTLWNQKYTISGVVNDFHATHFHEPILPLTLINDTKNARIAAVKLHSARLLAGSQHTEQTWKTFFPDQLYKGQFVDEMVAEFYRTEHILLLLAQVFSFIAILMGCLGVYGLVTFMAAARTKEIGIRKIMGARITQLLWIFGKEFGKLILYGFLLAAPLAWFIMHQWLQSYAYRIEIDWWVYAATLGLVTFITILSIAGVSLRAVQQNPVKNLRSE